ncbi:MAG: AIR synthase-related protein [Marinoscillum sp.]
MGAFDSNSGKVSEEHFKELLLGSLGASRRELICGAQFGVDTAVIDLGGGQALAVSSDPLSLIPSLGMEISAWLSVHLLINDMATTGFAPQYAQFVLNLPTSLSKADFSSYWQHIHEQCKQHNIAISGGHTGQIPGQESTISGGGTMFLHAPLHQIITSNKAQPGDSIIMTKSAAISSSSLLSMAFPETVANECGKKVQEDSAETFWKLSVLKEALIAGNTLTPHKDLHAMHDVTEGGVLGAVYEMTNASGYGFEVDLSKIAVHEEVRSVCELFAIDPHKSIGAGSMILSVKNGSEEQLLNALRDHGIDGHVIGQVLNEKRYDQIDKAGHKSTYVYTGIDPYWEAFFKALKRGWQ